MSEKKAKEVPTEKAILEYLKDKNRPFNSVDIATNLNYPKAKLMVLLEKMVTSGKIMGKPLSKNLIAYMAQQEKLDVDVGALQREVDKLKENQTKMKDTLKSLRSKVGQFRKRSTRDDCKSQIGYLRNIQPQKAETNPSFSRKRTGGTSR